LVRFARSLSVSFIFSKINEPVFCFIDSLYFFYLYFFDFGPYF
jgi:hypothetical protein